MIPFRPAPAATMALALLLALPASTHAQEKPGQVPLLPPNPEIVKVPVPVADPNEIVTEFPGIDLSVLSAEEMAKLVKRTNKEKCTCGCKDPSLAWCLKHHTGCPFAIPMVRLAATEVSPNYRKLQSEVDIVNWAKYRAPTEEMLQEYDYLKGFDLDALSPAQRRLLLAKTNTIMCDCGCVGDTLARCVNIDPTCTVAPAKIRALIEEIKQSKLVE